MNEAKQHSMFEYLFHPIEFDLDRDHKIVELTELSYFLLINQIEKERERWSYRQASEKYLLPHPDAPTRATVWPDGIVNEKFWRIYEQIPMVKGYQQLWDHKCTGVSCRAG